MEGVTLGAIEKRFLMRLRCCGWGECEDSRFGRGCVVLGMEWNGSGCGRGEATPYAVATMIAKPIIGR